MNYKESVDISERLLGKFRRVIVKEKPSEEAFSAAMFALSRSLVGLALANHFGNEERAITEISDCINAAVKTEMGLAADFVANSILEKEWDKFSKDQ